MGGKSKKIVLRNAHPYNWLEDAKHRTATGKKSVKTYGAVRYNWLTGKSTRLVVGNDLSKSTAGIDVCANVIDKR